MKPEKRPLRPEDLFQFKMGSHPRLSPNGLEVLWAVHRVDATDNCYYSNLWLTDTRTGETRPFTRGAQRDTQPVWSPDGQSMAFVSNRLKTPQIFLIPRHGGEAEVVSQLPEGSISSLSFSPDGSRLAFSFHQEVPPDDGRGFRPPAGMRIPQTAPRVRYLTRFPYKDEKGNFFDDGHAQLYTLELSSRVAKAVAPAPFHQHCPVFSPCGRFLAFYAIREEDPGWLLQGLDLWIAELATGSLRRVAERYGAPIAPAWSPDGQYIASIAFRDRLHSAEFHNEELMVFPVAGGAPLRPALELDRYCHLMVATDVKAPGTGSSPPVWSADGQRIRFLGMDHGETQLFEARLEGGPVKRVTKGPHCILDFHGVGDRAALLVADPGCIQDLWLLEPVGEHEAMRRLTAVNQDFLDGIDLGQVEEYWYKAEDGTDLQGWLTYPPGFDPKRQYPLVLQVHGGPHIQAGWIFFQEVYLLAAQGYVVLHVNPRGSHGYGEAFAGPIFGGWGTVDYDDLMTGVDSLLTAPWVDRDRLGVVGGSYGGFMTNWIVGHTQRFKAAVSHRSTTNFISAAGSSDMGYENARNAYGAQPWEDPQKLMEMSPISYVKNITTPLMLTQSDNDNRCPIEQAEQLYSALKQLGRTVAFCRFPEESHELSRWGRPDRRMERLYRTLEWFQAWL